MILNKIVHSMIKINERYRQVKNRIAMHIQYRLFAILFVISAPQTRKL
jgi:hypothetical protein